MIDLLDVARMVRSGCRNTPAPEVLAAFRRHFVAALESLDRAAFTVDTSEVDAEAETVGT